MKLGSPQISVAIPFLPLMGARSRAAALLGQCGFRRFPQSALKLRTPNVLALVADGRGAQAKAGTLMLCGPKGSEEPSILQCSICGRRTELFEVPERSEKYCLECSADVATSILLTTEIDAATMAGQRTEGLVAEFAELSNRLLERAQSA
jgi:hypothetical protein